MISVIIPTYNRRELLVRSVESVLAQTWQELEVLVVDDASTDGTEAWLRARVQDARVRYLRQERQQGACAARNRGIREARGAYIAFQDSDDVWRPDKLSTQMAQMEESGADIVFCAFARHRLDAAETEVFPHASIPEGRVTYEQLLFENLISTQTMLCRRACFDEDLFHPEFPRLQDWELVLRLSRRWDIRYFSTVLVDVYEQGDSISRQPEKAVRALRMLYEMHRTAIDRDARLSNQMLYAIQVACEGCGQTKGLWRDYLRAMSWHHTPRTNLRYIYYAANWMLRQGRAALGGKNK